MRRRLEHLSAAWKGYGPLALALLPALWAGRTLPSETPMGYDHATHLFKAWHFWTEMLGRGRLRGWSHFWGFGFPSDELVPCGGELWVTLFRALTLGRLSWLGTYALAFGALLALKAFAVFSFTRRHFGVAAAVIAAWVASLEPGEMLEGGWTWHTDWGVWPVTLAMSFALLALVKVEDLLRQPLKRDVIWAALWVAASLLTHQLAILVFVIGVPCLVLDHALCPERLRQSNLFAALLALALGAGLSGFFSVPFFAHGADTQDLGHAGDALSAVSERFLGLRTFQNLWPPIHLLGVLGAALAVRRRVAGGVYMAAAAALFVIASSDTLTADLHLERVVHSLIKVETNRMLLAAKLFWFPLAGFAVVELFQAGSRVARPDGSLPRWLGAATIGVLALALIVPGLPQFYATQIDKQIQGETETLYWHDFESLVAWSAAERQNHPEHYRIGYDLWRHNHLPTLAAIYDQTLLYNMYLTPTQIFDKLPMSDETPLLEALSVKYVVCPFDLHRNDLSLERRFGRLRVYRFNRYRPDPFTVLGQGHAELVSFEPERIVLRLTGTEASTRLKLHVASYSRWQATQGGRVLPIATVPVYGADYPMLMEVPAADGELVFEYVNRAPDWLGLFVSVGSLAALALLHVSARNDPRLAFAVDLPPRWRPRLGAAAAVAGLLILAFVVLRVRTRASLLSADSLFQRLQGPELRLGEFACSKAAPLAFRCGPHLVSAEVVSTGAWGMHTCMRAPDVGALEVDLQMPMGSFLLGMYDPAKEGAGRIEASIDGGSLGSLRTKPWALRQEAFEFDTRARAGQSAQLHLTLAGAALHCFDLRVVP